MAAHTERTPRLAVLIDADNSNPTQLEPLLAEIAKYGTASVKRAYGNWTTPQLGGWKTLLLTHSVQPLQQFSYTSGKNATDSAMLIDAMDLLYTGRFDGFCIVSSDSDFTRLASRIREQGLVVYGFGERKTPQPFVAACDKFIYTEILDRGASRAAPKKSASVKRDGRLEGLLSNAVESASDEDGWAQLGAVGSNLVRLAPDFDPRNYGYRKLKDLVLDQGGFEIEERKLVGGRSHAIYLRVKS